jgi:hypothetical protein
MRYAGHDVLSFSTCPWKATSENNFTAVRTKGAANALDDICDAADPVVVGVGQFLHTGWLHPHLACGGCNYSFG